jgi:hypothetical protein
MAMLTKQQVLKVYFRGQLPEAALDLLLQRFPELFRVNTGGMFDENYLPRFDPGFMALVRRVKTEVEAAQKLRKASEDEAWQKSVAEAAAQLSKTKHAHLRKKAAAELLKALNDDDDDTF